MGGLICQQQQTPEERRELPLSIKSAGSIIWTCEGKFYTSFGWARNSIDFLYLCFLPVLFSLGRCGWDTIWKTCGHEHPAWGLKSDHSVEVSQSIVIDRLLLSDPFHRDLWPSRVDWLPGNYCQVDPIAPLCHCNTRNLVLIRWMSNGIKAFIYFVQHRPALVSLSLATSFPMASGPLTCFGMTKIPSQNTKRK